MNKIRHFRQYWHDFMDIIYPRNCIACNITLQMAEEHICLNCKLNLPKTNFHVYNSETLARRFWGRITFESAWSFLYFEKGNAVQKILFHIKYKNASDLAEYMGHLYGLDLKDSMQADLIIPVPLHPKKLAIRGFNQSEAIANGLSKSLEIECRPDLIVRTVHTQTQTKKNREERWANVNEIFSCTDATALKDKSVIVLDDVVTTGATLESCAQTILNAGAKEVHLITLAIAN